jgi:PAS domain S-box-containing protein
MKIRKKRENQAKNGMMSNILPKKFVIKKKVNNINLQAKDFSYRVLFNNMITGLAYCKMIYDSQKKPIDFIYLMINKNFERLTGISRSVIGIKVTESIPGIKKSNPELFEIYGRVALTGKSEKFETYVKPLKRWFSISVYSPKKYFFVAIFENITEQKLLNKKLEDSKSEILRVLNELNIERSAVLSLAQDLEKYKLAVDNVSENIVINYPEGIFIYANKAIEKTTGYTPEEAIGKKSGSLWKTPMPVEFYKKLWDTIKVKKETFVSEIQNKRKNGEIYTAIISISPILDKKGNVGFFVAIERDVTKEREADKAKTEFVSVASHALRTPLTAIRGLVSMLLDDEYGNVNNDLRPPLKDIETSCERLISLVNDLLNISRIQAGRMRYELADCAIDELIKDVIHFMSPISEEKSIALISGKLDHINVQCDVEKTKEVLNNLIGNSFKFTDSGSITISTKEVGEMIEVSVEDTGIGIRKEDQSKLFGLFQQVESGAGRPIGTGFGLHVSRELVNKMGGDLWLERSEIGKGSIFTFSLPKSKTKPAEKAENEIIIEMKMHPDQKTAIMKNNLKIG